MNPLNYELSHLEALESEAIHIFREVAAQLERPVLLFSGGKDSIVLLRLAEKAFQVESVSGKSTPVSIVKMRRSGAICEVMWTRTDSSF